MAEVDPETLLEWLQMGQGNLQYYFPNCSGFFHGQNICPNLFPHTNFITELPLIINEEQKKSV